MTSSLADPFLVTPIMDKVLEIQDLSNGGFSLQRPLQSIARSYLNLSVVIFIGILAFLWVKPWKTSAGNPDSRHYAIPILRCTIPFVFDGLSFLRYASKRIPSPTTIRIPIFRDEVFVVQGPKYIAEFFQNPHLIVTRSYSLVLQQCFGMHQKAVNAYIADNSGSRSRPIPGSNPRLQDRISLMTHENLVSGLLQDGLGPAAERFERFLEASLQDEAWGHEAILGRHSWREEPDLDNFFQHHIGTSLVNALFGENITSQYPDFLENLWEYDANVMRLAQRIPSFCIPRAYRVRDRLLRIVKAWHSQGRAISGIHINRRDSKEENHWWGTKMMKDRYAMLLGATGQDEDSVASTDLALIWASITNVVPSTLALTYHIFNSVPLLSSIRTAIPQLPQPLKFQDLDSIPILASMYAETLRFGVQIHIPRSAPFHDLNIGGVRIQRNRLILANTWLAHTDEQVWNTKQGERPLDQFWAERFLLDPSDESSGPAKKRNKKSTPEDKELVHKGIQFSLEGLEGAWIPFGGGQHACPGRLLAKRIMLISAAIIISKFDVEFDLGDTAVNFDSSRFGFGVRKLNGPVRFRIRRR